MLFFRTGKHRHVRLIGLLQIKEARELSQCAGHGQIGPSGAGGGARMSVHLIGTVESALDGEQREKKKCRFL